MHVTQPMSSADISIFSPEISNICYIKKYRYKSHFSNEAFQSYYDLFQVNWLAQT